MPHAFPLCPYVKVHAVKRAENETCNHNDREARSCPHGMLSVYVLYSGKSSSSGFANSTGVASGPSAQDSGLHKMYMLVACRSHIQRSLFVLGAQKPLLYFGLRKSTSDSGSPP